MDPGHLMLNRSIFSLYPNLAAQLAASPPLLQNWGMGRPHPAFQHQQTNLFPAGEIKLERDSCGGSSASNASDTNGSGDEIDVDTIDNSSTSTRTSISANSLKFSIGNLLKEESPKITKPTSFWSPVQQILPHASFPSIFHHQNQHTHNHINSQQHASNERQHVHPACFSKIKQEENGAQTKLANFSCDLCGKTFKHVRMLNRHRRNHLPFKKYKCNFCGKGFNDSFDLKRHVRTHTGVKPYKCTQCDKSFTQRCSLESHQDKIHGMKPSLAYKARRDKIYVCEDCGFSTGDVREHYAHARSCTHQLAQKSTSSSPSSSLFDNAAPETIPMKTTSAF